MRKFSLLRQRQVKCNQRDFAFFIDDFPIKLRYESYRELSQMFDIIEKDNKRAVDPLCPCYEQFIEVQLTSLSN